ncbi:DUF4393 domain-containing protein [Kribbella sp. NPDC051718]|uniref:DUF4393 domain-containing protein n=1 Tax=Kribbella sp. NPDC051718 TaxID=3155168 RepID=UPI003441F4B0
MSGGEIVPAVAKAAVAGAKKVVDDKADLSTLQKLAAESATMQVAAESYARRVAVKQALLLKIYQPLARYLGVSRAYFDTDFHADMAGKLAGIPDEELVTPPLSLAIPAMEGLSYSLTEPNLKKMYLNLLATASDGRYSAHAHPAFAEIIKQLSPHEAEYLLEMLQETRPIVQLIRNVASGSFDYIDNHVLAIVDRKTGKLSDEPLTPVWVDNWIRLGLVTVDYTRVLTDEREYDWVERCPQYRRAIEGDERGAASVSIGRGMLMRTAFGARFHAAVTAGGLPSAEAGGSPLAPDRPGQNPSA